MNWFVELFTEHTFIQAVLVLSLICAIGLILGKIRIFGVSLGVTFVFFAGIFAGHFGLNINPEMLQVMQNFGPTFGQARMALNPLPPPSLHAIS